MDSLIYYNYYYYSKVNKEKEVEKMDEINDELTKPERFNYLFVADLSRFSYDLMKPEHPDTAPVVIVPGLGHMATEGEPLLRLKWRIGKYVPHGYERIDIPRRTIGQRLFFMVEERQIMPIIKFDLEKMISEVTKLEGIDISEGIMVYNPKVRIDENGNPPLAELYTNPIFK
ncbi:MAG: hypothetical protein ABH828_03860 [archaeon]